MKKNLLSGLRLGFVLIISVVIIAATYHKAYSQSATKVSKVYVKPGSGSRAGSVTVPFIHKGDTVMWTNQDTNISN